VSRRTFGARVRVLASVLGVAALLLPSLVVPVRAADVTFGTTTVKSTYNESITISVPFTAGVKVERVELWLRFPDTIGPYINVITAPPGDWPSTLTYLLDLTGGNHLVPNTTLEATWAAYPAAAGDPVLSSTQTVHYTNTTHN